MLLIPDQRQELGPSGLIGTKHTQHAGGLGRDTLLANAPGRHALVLGLEHNGNTTRCERGFDRMRDVYRHGLLDLETLGEGIDHAGELRDTHDTPDWDVPNM